MAPSPNTYNIILLQVDLEYWSDYLLETITSYKLINENQSGYRLIGYTTSWIHNFEHSNSFEQFLIIFFNDVFIVISSSISVYSENQMHKLKIYYSYNWPKYLQLC